VTYFSETALETFRTWSYLHHNRQRQYYIIRTGIQRDMSCTKRYCRYTEHDLPGSY